MTGDASKSSKPTASSSSFFSTVSGKPIAVSNESLEKAANILTGDASKSSKPTASSSSFFSTVSGKPIAVSKESLEKAANMLTTEDKSSNPAGSVSSGFSTVSGQKIAISEAALSRAKEIFVQDNFQHKREEKKTPARLSGKTFVTPRFTAPSKVSGNGHISRPSTGRKRRSQGFVTPRLLPGKVLPSHQKKESAKRQKVNDTRVLPPPASRLKLVEMDRLENTDGTITNKKAPEVTSQNAIGFTFVSEFDDPLTWRDFHARMVTSRFTNDGAVIDKYRCTGAWVANHYRWIIWKLAAMERRFPDFCKGKWLSPKSVLRQLKFRYQREFIECRRSALATILEGDASPSRFMVLCVSNIKESMDGKSVSGEVTDGWYAIEVAFDHGMVGLVKEGKIFIGMKLCIQQADVSYGNNGGGRGVNPLECLCNLVSCDDERERMSAHQPKLSLSKNACRTANWSAKLGFQKQSFFPLRLRSIDGNDSGSIVGCIEVVVVRRFALVYMEKKADGSTKLRSEMSERRALDELMGKGENETLQRQVSTFFRIDAIDVKNMGKSATAGACASITMWGASHDQWESMGAGTAWRFFGLSNRGSASPLAFNFNKRSSCSPIKLPFIDPQFRIPSSMRSRVLLKTIVAEYEGGNQKNAGQNCIDVVAAMVGESCSGNERYLFFVDESGVLLSLRLAMDMAQDLPSYRSGTVCALLNISVAGYDKVHKILSTEWRVHSSSSIATCEEWLRPTFSRAIGSLRTFASSLEGKITMGHIKDETLSIVLNGRAKNKREEHPGVHGAIDCATVCGGHIVAVKKCLNEKGMVCIDVQNGLDCTSIILTCSKEQLPAALDKDLSDEWKNVPLFLAQLFWRIQADRDGIVVNLAIETMRSQLESFRTAKNE